MLLWLLMAGNGLNSGCHEQHRGHPAPLVRRVACRIVLVPSDQAHLFATGTAAVAAERGKRSSSPRGLRKTDCRKNHVA